MARKKRIWYPGATYHIMSRGNEKAPIFKEHGDYLLFLKFLRSIKEKYPFTLHSICLMTNHFHLELETKDIELWKIMHGLLGSYAEAFNYKHSRTGHLFQGRYTACLINNNQYFLEVSRYIHLNPVKAMIVNEPADYLYSSYNLFVPSIKKIDQQKMSAFLADMVDTSRVLSLFPNDSVNQYREFVENALSHEEHEILIQKEMREDNLWQPW